MAAAADRNLLFGLLALQYGLIDQDQLVAAFRAWSRDKGRQIAEYMVERGDLDADQRDVVQAMVGLHEKKHGGSTEKSLAAIPAGRSTRESLAALGDREIEGTLARVGSGPSSCQSDVEADRTASYAVGSVTSDGQRFRVLRPHGRGGLGAVFVALDTELHREVALKQILDRHADDPVSRQRFVIEAEVTGGLEHPGIVPVYGLGTYADGRPYYAMRFIKGDSLKEAIERFQYELANTCDSLATNLNAAGRRDEAVAAFDRARDLGEELFRAKTADARIAHELVRTLANLAITLDSAGRQNEALAAFDRAREVLAVMENANPSLLAVTRDRAWIDLVTAQILNETPRQAEALAVFERARHAREILVKADPTVIRDQAQLVDIHCQIARIHARDRREREALESYKQAMAVGSKLASDHPGDSRIQSQLAGVYEDLAEFHGATGTPSEALNCSEHALGIRRKLVEAGPSQPSRQRGLASGLRNRGIVLQKCRRPAEAVSAFRQSITIFEGLANPTEVDLYNLACEQSLLSGVAGETGSGLTIAQGRAVADKAMASLRLAVAAGWKQANLLGVDSDFDPIRSRPDFQLLMMDLAFPKDPFARGR